MATNIFKGLGIALVTPFKTDGSIDYMALKRLVGYQTENGADFLCVLGTTGETPCLDREEREEVKRFVVEVNQGNLPVLLGCGGNNTVAVVKELQTMDLVVLTEYLVFVHIIINPLKKDCIDILK